MPNYDEKTGIHYGVISPHSISPYALDDIYTNGTDPQYEEGKTEFRQNVFDVLNEYLSTDECDIICDEAIERFNERWESDGSGIMDYSDQDYTLHVSGDNFGIFVINSPYYTFTKQCSSCAPGAGDLNNPVSIDDIDSKMPNFYNVFSPDNHVKAYCLDKSYFEDEKVPYKVYRVDNDQEVV